MEADVDLYERDLAEWAFHNADLLRSGRLTEADIVNIAEEIDSLGRSQTHELESRITQIMEHLLKLRLTSGEVRDRNRRLWLASIERQRGEIEGVLEASPSLKSKINRSFLGKCYSHAARVFALGFEIEPPKECPFNETDILGG